MNTKFILFSLQTPSKKHFVKTRCFFLFNTHNNKVLQQKKLFSLKYFPTPKKKDKKNTYI